MLVPPVVTALTAGILILMQMALLLLVVRLRWRHRQSLSDGGHPSLVAAIARHGNLAENAALFIAGFALLETLGGTRETMEILCGAFILARISHAIGLSLPKTHNPFRMMGVIITVFVGVGLALRLITVAMVRLGV